MSILLGAISFKICTRRKTGGVVRPACNPPCLVFFVFFVVFFVQVALNICILLNRAFICKFLALCKLHMTLSLREIYREVSIGAKQKRKDSCSCGLEKL